MPHASFLRNMLGLSNTDNGDRGDPSLRQGAKFNSMQNIITKGVLPELPLMDQTTMPGLKSITLEGMENLNTVNKREWGAPAKSSLSTNVTAGLVKKNGDEEWEDTYASFNKNLSNYATTYNNLMLGSMGVPTNPNTPGDTKGSSNINDFISKRATLSHNLLNIANNLTQRTLDIKNKRKGLIAARQVEYNKVLPIKGVGNDRPPNSCKGSNSRTCMKNLGKANSKFEQLLGERDTLQSEINDNILQSNASYLHYLVWFVAATTLIAVGVHQIKKD